MKQIMDMPNDEAQRLLELPKKIVVGDRPQDNLNITFTERICKRFNLRSEDGNQIFLFNIQQQAKSHLKISLHFQENSQYIGLLRLEYQNSHKNPERLNQYVPEMARPYCGQYIDESHIHIYVQGYNSLAWAVPLDAYGFSAKSIESTDAFFCAVQEFCDKISVATKCEFSGRLFL